MDCEDIKLLPEILKTQKIERFDLTKTFWNSVRLIQKLISVHHYHLR